MIRFKFQHQMVPGHLLIRVFRIEKGLFLLLENTPFLLYCCISLLRVKSLTNMLTSVKDGNMNLVEQIVYQDDVYDMGIVATRIDQYGNKLYL